MKETGKENRIWRLDIDYLLRRRSSRDILVLPKPRSPGRRRSIGLGPTK